MHSIWIWVKNVRINIKTWNIRVMETAFLFDIRTWQNKFRVAEEPIDRSREAVGQTGLSMEAQGIHNPRGTVEPWEGPCHPRSPSLKPLKGAGGEQSMCVLYLLVKESKTLQHAQSSSGHSQVIHLSLYLSFLSNGIWRYCGLHWEHLSLSLVCMVEQRKGACREEGNRYNPALKTLEAERGWHLMVQVQAWGRLGYCSCWFVGKPTPIPTAVTLKQELFCRHPFGSNQFIFQPDWPDDEFSPAVPSRAAAAVCSPRAASVSAAARGQSGPRSAPAPGRPLLTAPAPFPFSQNIAEQIRFWTELGLEERQ